MGLLTEMGRGQGYLKAGFLGFQASGKTLTAVLLAIGLQKQLKLNSRIAMFDTEGGSEYIAKRVKEETGQALIGVKSQSFQDLLDMGEECLQANVGILLVDSVTHIWREICDSYLEHVNTERAKKHIGPRTKLEFQDWGPIKKKWAEWTTFYLNAPLHIIICGRAGFEYDQEVNEETGKKELIKTGTKMKTETEFGFEPSLLIEMERLNLPDKQGGFKTVHHATCVKDRFDVMDGAEVNDPTFEYFLPHVARLTPGANTPISQRQTPMTVDEQGRNEWDRMKMRRTKAWEEIENGLAILYPSSQGKDKQTRFMIYQELTGSTSETKIQGLPPEQLELIALTIKQLGQDVLAGLVLEPTAVPAYVRCLFDRLVAGDAMDSAHAPVPAAEAKTTSHETKPADPDTKGTDPDTKLELDPWFSEVIDCEDFLRRSRAGQTALQTMRKGFKLKGDDYPLLEDDRADYLKHVRSLVSHAQALARKSERVTT